jgi:hypothetical protein
MFSMSPDDIVLFKFLMTFRISESDIMRDHQSDYLSCQRVILVSIHSFVVLHRGAEQFGQRPSLNSVLSM